jgi:hypothetical protein
MGTSKFGSKKEKEKNNNNDLSIRLIKYALAVLADGSPATNQGSGYLYGRWLATDLMRTFSVPNADGRMDEPDSLSRDKKVYRHHEYLSSSWECRAKNPVFRSKTSAAERIIRTLYCISAVLNMPVDTLKSFWAEETPRRRDAAMSGGLL